MAIAYLIIEKKPELSNEDIKNLFNKATDKEKIAEAIINKTPNLSDDNVSTLLNLVNNKYEIAINYKFSRENTNNKKGDTICYR